jgi:hypothetical protein
MFPKTLSVMEMLHKLCLLLPVEPVILPDGLITAMDSYASIFSPQASLVTTTKTINFFYCEASPEFPDIAEEGKPRINGALAKTKMPWLVPACSIERLESAVGSAGAELFCDASIAGLVPGVTRSSFDACAYMWAEGAPLEWAYEFKSGSYNVADAVTDLNKKALLWKNC